MNILALAEDAGPILTAAEAVMDNATLIEQKADAFIAALEKLEADASTAGVGLFTEVKDEGVALVASLKAGFTSMKALFEAGKTAITTTAASGVAAPAATPATGPQTAG